MPYPRAHYYVGGLVLLSFWGFWPSYLSNPDAVQWQHHAHGATAGAWLLLLIFQSWAIHNGKRDLHRSTGKAVFVMAPLLLAGLLLIIGLKAGMDNPFREMFGDPLLAYDLVSIVFIAYFIYAAMANRRNAWLHSGYMLATPFFLLGPIIGRILPQVIPALGADLSTAIMPLHITTAAAIPLAFWLYMRNRKFGQPFLLVGIAMIAQLVLYAGAGRTEWWGQLNPFIAKFSGPALIVIGLALGAAVLTAGWRRPAHA